MKKVYIFFLATIMIVLVAINIFAQPVNVTFQVDMQDQIVSADGVHLAGSFSAPLPHWVPNGILLDPPITGTVYSVTLSLDPGTILEYKFINGDSWDLPDVPEIIPPCCEQGGNRFLTIPNKNVILPAMCFGECTPCNNSPVLRDITFQVDLSDASYTDGAFIAGTLQEPQWTPEPMTPMGNDIFEITLSLEENACHIFKFVIDSVDWETVPEECGSGDGFGGFNRFLTIPQADSTLDLVCFGACFECDAVEITFKVDMSNETISGEVFIAGNFNGWNSTANSLTDMGSNIWETTLILQKGQDIQYKFINDTIWELIPAACSWGGGNRHFVVPENPYVMDAVCFGSCNACTPAVTADVTFVVDMSSQLVSGTGVFLGGDFNEWSLDATPMIDMGNNIYEVTVNLGEGFIYGYKFINGDQGETVPGECNYNDVRTVIVPVGNSTLPLDCYNECGPCTTTLYTFDLSVILEGFYTGSNMNTTMFDDGIIPVDQPYSGSPWNYPGTEQLSALPGSDVVDWIYIQLRETNGDASTAIIDSLIDHQAALVLTDGTVATSDGSPNIYYSGNIVDNLYIVIYHRNHLAIMSADPLVEISGTFSFDFTDSQSKAYLDGQKVLSGEKYGMFGGDFDGDGVIGAADILEWSNHAGHAGYNSSDSNADTQINNPDKNDIWDPNQGINTQVPN